MVFRSTVLALAAIVPTCLGAAGRAEDFISSSVSISDAESRIVPDVRRARVGPRPTCGTVSELDLDALREWADRVPAEVQGVRLRDDGATFAIPHPDGRLIDCIAVRSPVMHPALSERYPQIRTFRIQTADGSAHGRMELTPHGLSAMLRALMPDGSAGAWMIDAWNPGEPSRIVSYWLRDLPGGEHQGWTCHTREGIHGRGADHPDPAVELRGPPEPGVTLRTVRLAVACTGEYGLHQCQILGNAPNLVDPLAAIAVSVSRANVVFEADLAVRFELVAANDQIVYVDPATDPYPDSCDGTGGSDCSGPYLPVNIAHLASAIGNDNFDIGHLLTRVYGGVAYLSSVCGANKAGGISGITRGGDVDALAFLILVHELGHQFGARHTFSGTRGRCAGNATLSSAWEAGSGSSPMAYAGGCPVGDAPPSDNVAIFADPYFHHGSISQMQAFLVTAPCAAQSIDENRPPSVTSTSPSRAIPPGTPFRLEADVTDPDGDPVWCSWEQFDSGVARPLTGTGSADNGRGALFRVFPPVAATDRSFPRMADVLSGVPTPGERLPTVEGFDRRFRLVARDNHPGAGGTVISPLVTLTIAPSEPFAVISPGGDVVLSPGPCAVEWIVGATAAAPIACSEVDIRLSTDGGATFAVDLGTHANTGAAVVELPPDVAAARLRVEAVGNVFFAVSGPFSVGRCPADFNASGGVTVQDVFDYLAAYFSGSPAADFNGSGSLGVQDIFDFLVAYFLGC